jgi:hypothetical protein
MLKIEKNHEHFVICGPLAKFLLLKLILRPTQQSEFDMPDLDQQDEMIIFELLLTIFVISHFLMQLG